MTSKPASRSARAMIFAPRSWPSRPGLATMMRRLRCGVAMGDLRRREGSTHSTTPGERGSPEPRPHSMRLACTLLLALLAPASAGAWDRHADATRVAFTTGPGGGGAPALPHMDGSVAVEPLEAFLAAQETPLASLLDEEERWARAHVPRYPPRPEALRFAPAAPGSIRTRFLEALRVSPTIALALPAGPLAAPLEVVAAASDEPDQGMDLGLFEDCGTPYGVRYGLGPLPFGNPTLSFATQAPFHMGFYYESRLLTALAPALLRTYPELRIHQFAA